MIDTYNAASVIRKYNIFAFLIPFNISKRGVFKAVHIIRTITCSVCKTYICTVLDFNVAYRNVLKFSKRLIIVTTLTFSNKCCNISNESVFTFTCLIVCVSATYYKAVILHSVLSVTKSANRSLLYCIFKSPAFQRNRTFDLCVYIELLVDILSVIFEDSSVSKFLFIFGIKELVFVHLRDHSRKRVSRCYKISVHLSYSLPINSLEKLLVLMLNFIYLFAKVKNVVFGLYVRQHFTELVHKTDICFLSCVNAISFGLVRFSCISNVRRKIRSYRKSLIHFLLKIQCFLAVFTCIVELLVVRLYKDLFLNNMLVTLDVAPFSNIVYVKATELAELCKVFSCTAYLFSKITDFFHLCHC